MQSSLNFTSGPQLQAQLRAEKSLRSSVPQKSVRQASSCRVQAVAEAEKLATATNSSSRVCCTSLRRLYAHASTPALVGKLQEANIETRALHLSPGLRVIAGCQPRGNSRRPAAGKRYLCNLVHVPQLKPRAGNPPPVMRTS